MVTIIEKDKYGHPTLFIRGKHVLINDKNKEHMKRFGIYLIEKLCVMMGPDIDKLTYIIDMEGTSNKNLHIGFLKGLLSMLSDMYPERVFRFYTIRINWFLKVVWAIV